MVWKSVTRKFDFQTSFDDVIWKLGDDEGDGDGDGDGGDDDDVAADDLRPSNSRGFNASQAIRLF